VRVFLSWSGELSRDVARVFAQTLPVLFEDVEPFEASGDIEKGKRWGPTLATVLSECSYGIICLTRSNLNMPWILFEAGALSKLDTSHVAPFLLGLKPSEVKSPLADFQITSYNEEDVKRLIRSINASLDRPRANANLEGAWRLWWPDFKAQIDALEAKVDQATEAPQRDVGVTNQETLEEILELARDQRRLLGSPEAVLPEAYITRIVRNVIAVEERKKYEYPPAVPASLAQRAAARSKPVARDPFVDDAAKRLGAIRSDANNQATQTTIADAEEQAAAEDAALNDWLDDAEQAIPNSPDELSAQP